MIYVNIMASIQLHSRTRPSYSSVVSTSYSCLSSCVQMVAGQMDENETFAGTHFFTFFISNGCSYCDIWWRFSIPIHNSDT